MNTFFQSSGNISFVLYGAFILLIIIAMLFAFHTIKNEKIDRNKMDQMISIFKYSIVSVALSTVTLIVSDLFKERE